MVSFQMKTYIKLIDVVQGYKYSTMMNMKRMNAFDNLRINHHKYWKLFRR